MTKPSQRDELPPAKLHVKVIELLEKRQCTIIDVQKVTGIKQGWISAFLRGKIKDPSANRLEPIYEFLSGKKLDY